MLTSLIEMQKHIFVQLKEIMKVLKEIRDLMKEDAHEPSD